MLWKYWLVNAADMTPITELSQARDRNLSLIWNKPGSAGFKYPMSDEWSAYINPWTTGIIAYRYNWRASLAMNPYASVWDAIWSGVVQPIDEDISGDSMQVNCVGWLDRLNYRMTRRDKNYVYQAGVQWDDADIIFDLINEMNLPIAPDGTGKAIYGLPGAATPTLLTVGAKKNSDVAYSPAYRGLSIPKYSKVGPQIDLLINNVENGADLVVDPKTRVVDIYRKKVRYLDNVIFGFNWGPANVQSLGRQLDPTIQVNEMIGTGAPGLAPQLGTDPTSETTYGTLEEVAALPDITSQNVMQSYVNEEIYVRKDPRQIIQITPFSYSPGSNVPEPFVDYAMGDRVRFSALWKPRINIQNLGVRVFGMNVGISDDDNETLQALSLSPGGQ